MPSAEKARAWPKAMAAYTAGFTTCGLTAKRPGSAPSPTLANRAWD